MDRIGPEKNTAVHLLAYVLFNAPRNDAAHDLEVFGRVLAEGTADDGHFLETNWPAVPALE